MTTFARNSHPEPETVAAFVEGNVTGAELAALTEHLRECEECRRAAGEAARFDAEERRTQRPPRRWWLWGALAAAAAAIIVVVGVIAPALRNPLTAVRPEYRTWPGQVSEFGYMPFRVMRGNGSGASYERLAAAARLEKACARERSAENVHRFALAQLALGRTDDAIRLLREASALAPADATLLSDLSVAQLAAGDASDAAESAARAMDLDPRYSAAVFNWALALEQLANKPAAIDAWNHYLRRDRTSRWADEARAHLAALTQPRADWDRDRKLLGPAIADATLRRVVAVYPQRVRYWVQDELLPEWCRSRRRGDLRLARRIALIRAASGDRFLLDTVAFAEDVTPAKADAVLAFQAAVRTFRRPDLVRAAVELRTASTKLAAVSSPLWRVSEIYRATNECYDGRYDEALQRLAEVGKRTDAGRYPSIAGQVGWVRGLVFTMTGRNDEALRSYRQAAAEAARAGETEGVVALSTLLSGLLDNIGEQREAERFRETALRRSESIDGSPQRLYVAFIQAAFAALRERRPRTALAFTTVLQEIARSTREPLYLAESSMLRALALRDLGRSDHARIALRAARQDASRIALAGFRDRTLVDIALVDGTDAELSQAVALASRYSWRRREVAARLQRGDLSLRSGHWREAEAQWRTALAVVEEQRENLSEPALRVTYFERSEGLFERLIRLLLDTGRTEAAFDIAERKRARALLDTFANAPVPVRWADVERQLEPDTELIAYAVLDGELVVWTGRKGRLTVERRRVRRAELESACAQAVDAMSSGRDPGAALAGLSALLPADLGGVRSVVVVPDGALHRLPFAALEVAKGEYLVQRVSLTVAPSISVFAARQRDRGAGGLMLAIEGSSRGSPLLPEAEKEARAIAGLYADGSVLDGRSADVDQVRRVAAAASVIHFAGHALAEPALGGGAALVLRPDCLIRAAQIASWHLQRSPVVVLAACATAAGAIRRNEGPDTLAAAFLTAGARDVVGTLWDADDDASARLFTAFHREILGGASPADALRLAQLRMLRSSDARDRAPSSWANAVLFGSN